MDKMDKMDETHETDHIRARIIQAQEMRDKYALEFEELCIKHSIVSDIEDAKDKNKKDALVRNYIESKYYHL